MTWDLINKVVVITGGAEGIGYEIANKYLHNGAKTIIILDINDKLGAEAAEKLTTTHGASKVVFLKCDITTDIEEVSKVIFSSYTVDILVNSAGIFNETLLKKTIDINVTGLIECSFKFWEHMRKDKGGNGGTIINVASICCFYTDRYYPIYQASKFAVMGFTKALGHIANFEKFGVRVVTLCPGATDTRLTKKLITLWNDDLNAEFEAIAKSLHIQKVDLVGNAAVEIYQKAKSGSAWIIEGGKPVFEVTE